MPDKLCMNSTTCTPADAEVTMERPTQAPTSLNCLSVDVEEYFHAEAFHASVSPSSWPAMQRRAEPFLEQIAELLATHGSRATFFVLGDCVRPMAPLLKNLAMQGHEIACHGHGHQHFTRMTPQSLHEDLRRARHTMEDLVGVRPRGYRAPTFSLTHATAWALDVIIAERFEYDCGIYPIRHDRYGVPDAPLDPFWAVAPSGARILEFPPLALDWRYIRFPVGGGGYLRLLPANLISHCLTAHERDARPAMIYLHPWELDPDQPRLPLGRLAQWRHRVNLHKTKAKLEYLLSRHRFDTAANILGSLQTAKLPVHALGNI